MNIGFTKMHGLGNDFVVIDNMNGRINLSKEQIVFLCDRHKGIGADGVILIEPSDKADCFMNYYNSDGTAVEMCGNGVRCVAKFLKDEIKKTENNFEIDTRAGIKEVEYLDDGTFSVNMGKPVFSHKDFPENPLTLEGLEFNFVSVGNPHAISFVDDVNIYDIQIIGPRVENNPNFPNKINVHIVQEINKGEFKVKIWERGCGVTLASGTSSCAIYAVARKYKNADKEIIMQLPGGKLFMSENNEGDIVMQGPAVSVFSSMIYVKE
ncbi:MAG TPA: diaminopimelate epimerase [Candidatus Paceibacterota bacterium]|jgi:diaminopimelate epimerase|nr:diaminopimelate epimerase [Candidatus Paceibacterota bacterium]